MQKFIILTLVSFIIHAHAVSLDKKGDTKTPDYLQVEKEVINVPLPSSTTTTTPSSISSDPSSDVINSGLSKDSKSNVKPRKGVTFDQQNNNNVSTSTSYSVAEDVDEPHPVAPIIINTNTTINVTSLPIAKPSPKGEVIPLNDNNDKNLHKEPKKPEITFSPEDNPEILKASSAIHKVTQVDKEVPSHSVHSVEEPTSAFSQEFIKNVEDAPGFASYLTYVIISAIVLIFIAIPIVFGRKMKDYWATRHYRRVDFLVDGMYND